jgi:hypothetical protein
MLEGVIARMHPQIRAQEREIEKLRRAGVGTALAELLLVRMRAKVDDLWIAVSCSKSP